MLSVDALQVSAGAPLADDATTLVGLDGAVVSRTVRLQVNCCDVLESASRELNPTVQRRGTRRARDYTRERR